MHQVEKVRPWDELKEDIEPQDFVLNQFNLNLKGQNLKNLVDKYQVKFSIQAKSSFSLLINRILKVDDKTKIRDLEENGIAIKTIPVSPKNKPWEAMSFPKFSLVDLIEEEWESDENEAEFKKIITQGFIFIPIIKEKEKYIDKGEIKEVGTHEELLNKNGMYSQLSALQYAAAKE